MAPTTKVALALALVGLALLARPEPGDLDGVLLAIAAGVAFAAWTLLSKLVVADIGGFWLGFSNLAIAGLVLAPWALRADWSDARQSWSWLLVLGLGMTALLGPLYLVVLDHLPASTASVLLYLEPLSALLLAWAVPRRDAHRDDPRRWQPDRRRRHHRPTEDHHRRRHGGAVPCSWVTTCWPGWSWPSAEPCWSATCWPSIRPPAEVGDGDLRRAPTGRSLLMAGIGLIATIWALASLVAGS